MGILFNEKRRYGCGSGIFFLPNHFFHEACKQHDIAYFEEKGNRHDDDFKFLVNMLNITGNSVHYIFMAFIFYIIVVLVGGIFYTNDTKK